MPVHVAIAYQPDHVEKPQPKLADLTVAALTHLRERESSKLNTVREELSRLEPAAIARLLTELKENFITRKMSPAVMKRLEEGKWESALIMGELARFYWKQTRGTDWSTADSPPDVVRVEQAGLL